jgi:DNA-binding response OmpR family regulator
VDSKLKILIIEDNEEVVDSITIGIQIRWPSAEVAATPRGLEGLKMLAEPGWDLVILDLGLLDTSGFEVLKRLRTFSSVPVIILTVHKEEKDIIKGLELGADDYMVKPFHQLELTSRINTILRRSAPKLRQATLTTGDLKLDVEERRALVGNKEIHLTRNEMNILRLLMENSGKTVSHSALAEAVWGACDPELADSLKVHIRRLREKIQDNPGIPRIIITNSGTGYLLNPPI